MFTTVSMDRIPPELLVKILRQAATQGSITAIEGKRGSPFETVDYSTLVTCCLVCRDWKAITTPILRSLDRYTIGTKQDVERMLSAPPEELKTTHLTVNSVYYDKELARKLPSLTHLALKFCWYYELGLQLFDSHDPIVSGVSLGESLLQPALGNLQCLRIAATADWVEDFQPLSSQPAFHLSELHVLWTDSPSLWRSLFEFNSDTLASLTLYIRAKHLTIDPFAPPFGPQLTHLAIYGHRYSKVNRQPQDAFRASTELRSAGIATRNMITDVPDTIEELVINDAEVHDLEGLRDVRCGNGVKDWRRERKQNIPLMAETVSNALLQGRLPRLRRLTCCGYFDKQEQGSSKNAKVVTFREVLEKRGISLHVDATSVYW